MQFFKRCASSWIVKLLFAVVAVSFISWGVQTGINTGGKPRWAIKVGEIEYSVLDWERMVSAEFQRVQQENLEVIPNISHVRHGAFKHAVAYAILIQEAKKAGFIISDEMVGFEISKIPAFQDKQGKFDQKKFQKVLRNGGISEADFITKTKEEMAYSQYMNFFRAGNKTVLEPLVDAITQVFNAKHTLWTFKVVREYLPKAATLCYGKEEVAAFWEQNKSDFATAEERDVSYVLFGKDLLNKQTVIVEESEIEDLYRMRKHMYTLEEKRSIKQIILPSREDAIGVKNQLESGHSLDDIKREYSVKTNKAQIIDLEKIGRGDLSDEIAQLVFKLAPGDISEPVNTALGWHLFEVVEVFPEQIKSIEQVKSSLKQQLEMEKRAEILNDLMQRIGQDVSEGLSLENIASKYSLKVSAAQRVRKEKYTEEKVAGKEDDLGIEERGEVSVEEVIRDTNFIRGVFSNEELTVSTPIPLKADTDFVVIRVEKIREEHIPSFSESEGAVQSACDARKAETELEKFAQELQERVNSTHIENGDLSDFGFILDGLGKLKDTHNRIVPLPVELNVSYIDLASVKGLPAPFVDEVLRLKPWETSHIYKCSDGGYIFAQLKKITYLSSEEARTRRPLFTSKAANVYQDIVMGQYLSSLFNAYVIKVNPSAIEGVN